MNRGGKGNGFVTKLTNGKFMAKMPAGTYPNGQTRYRTKTCATRPLANKALREMVHQSEAHQLIAGPEVKFRDFATQITFHQERVSVRTATEYLRLLRKWVFPVFGGRPIRDITASEAQAFLHQLRLKRSASTVNSVRTAMSAVFTAAEKLELVVFNPMRRTEKARTQLYEKTQVEEPWSVEEVNHVRQVLANKPLEPIIMLLLMTGMRIGEALALEWSDIDLVDGRVNINKTMSHLSILQPDGGSLHKADVRPPKTKAGYRSIDIPEPMVAILQRYKLEQDLQRSCQGGRVAKPKPGLHERDWWLYQRLKPSTSVQEDIDPVGYSGDPTPRHSSHLRYGPSRGRWRPPGGCVTNVRSLEVRHHPQPLRQHREDRAPGDVGNE